MPDNLLSDTEESVIQTLNRFQETLDDLVNTVKPLPQGLERALSDIAELKLISAIKEVPDTAKDVAKGVGETTGSAGETVATGVGVVPAVASDVLEDASSVEGTTEHAVKRASAWHRPLKRRR